MTLRYIHDQGHPNFQICLFASSASFKMSGLEVLGFILNVYPVIIDSLNTHRAIRRGVAKHFLRSLEVEQLVFGQFVHNLLASELSETDLALLRDEKPCELEIWKNEDQLSKVGRRLGPKRSETILNTLRDITGVLKTLRKEINDIVVDEKVSPCPQSINSLF